MNQSASQLHSITAGQVLLIVCCIFYLIWWSLSYRPGLSVNRIGGCRGILLFVTALSGIAGLVLSIAGMNLLEMTRQAPFSNLHVSIGGIALYLVLLLITRYGLHRVVTTELVLITGWTILELCLINSLYGAGVLNSPRFAAMLIVIAAAFVTSMILYVLYYRMEEMKAFYAAMVPLITEAASMSILLGVIFL